MQYDQTLYELIDRFLAGEMDAEALGEFETRLKNEPDLAEEVRLQREVAEAVLDEDTRDFEKQLKLLGERITSESQPPNESTAPSSNSWMRYIAIAAGIALLVTISLFFLRNPEDQTSWVTSDQQQSQTLSDSSKVVLMANSKLSYQEGFEKNSRALSLEGAAHFEVAEDAQRPFTVRSGEIRTTVLGTSFSLRAYPSEDTTWIEVYHGKVSFSLSEGPEDKGLVLLANETAGWTQTNGFFKQRGLRVPDPVTGTQSKLNFKNTPLSQVGNAVGEFYGVDVQIELEETAKCQLSGKFNSSLVQTTIEAITFALGLEFQNRGDTLFTLTGVCQ